ncbi:MAG: DUF695 domain-containing protein [Pyrinomonadaceae bacterium]|nr:DUF695 domain-containing protein [Pyrinomonadaceae bacterium]
METENYQEDWAVYFCTCNEDEIGSVLVDLGYTNMAPIESKSYLITVTTFMNNPGKDGLSSNEESDVLNKIEDYFIESINKEFDSIYAGRLKYGGKILSYFYSSTSEKIQDTIDKLKHNFPDYRFEYSIKEEKDWRAYFEVLYPSPFEMQVIQNGRVVENIESHGDNLQKERQVDHWIYFQTGDDRENFLKSIEGNNFEIVNKDKTNFGDSPFSLQLSRIDKVDYESVNEYVMYLWQKAQEFNGNYDGWETFIVRD